jgi:WD40 repeat protein
VGRGHVVTTSYRTATLWDAASGKKIRTFQGHTDEITDVTLSDDGKHLWTVSEDRTTRLWDPTTGKERCQLYSLNMGADWLVVTPDGRFDGSKDAWRFVAYREPGTLKLLDDDASLKRFHRPGLLAQVRKGER